MKDAVIRCVDSKVWFYLFLALTFIWLAVQTWAFVVMWGAETKISVWIVIMALAVPASLYGFAKAIRWVIKKALT